MKILFLDFDGVINTPFINEKDENGEYTTKIGSAKEGWASNREALMLINKLCLHDNSFIIIPCSTWNTGHSRKDMKDILQRSGLDPAIRVGEPVPQKIWDEKNGRAQNIINYLKEHKLQKESFIIIDDDADFDIEYRGKSMLERLIQTDPDIGFCFKDYMKIREKLGLDSPRRTLSRYKYEKNPKRLNFKKFLGRYNS